jgi:serine/threonine-protein kinase
MIGKSFSHYKVVEKLGEGGMGVVWKALDTELDREVAIKVLPEQFAEDPERLARFEREAKILASLNHRNIASIYGLAQEQGTRFLVMELVEGEDLAQKLIRGPLSVEAAIDVGHQLARALDAAHGKGVLHRDLKPANIQITPEGQVKVLDFGLAKEFQVEGADLSRSPTLTSVGTTVGTILGTAGYMSPEQARGKTLDKRTDIWAFGCVLYECLTGRSAFVGETLSDTVASILKGEPNWTALPDGTPPRIRELLQRCLAKDVKSRLRDIGDARVELKQFTSGAQTTSDTSGIAVAEVPLSSRSKSFSKSWLTASLVIGLVAGAGLWSFFSRSGNSGDPSPTRTSQLSVSIPPELSIRNFGFLASPAGNALGFAAIYAHPENADQAAVQVYMRHFENHEPKLITGTAGNRCSTFSPDGRWLALVAPVAPRSAKLRLSKVSVDGSSPPLTLLDWPKDWVCPLSWLPDGRIVARTVDGESLVTIPADGSPPLEPVEVLTEGYEGEFVNTGADRSILPDGVHLLGNAITFDETGYELNVAILNLETGESRILIENGSNPQYWPPGHLLFTREDALLAVRFDLNTLAPDGAQVAIADGLRTNFIWDDAWFDVTPEGSLLHFPGGVVGGSRRLVFLDGDFNVIGPWSEELRAFENSLEASPDGRKLAVSIVNAEGLYDIWVSEIDSPRLSRLVKNPGEDCTPALWHPDGERLVYTCGSTGQSRMLIRNSDGSDEPQLLIKTLARGEQYFADAFLPDGATLVVTHARDNKFELMLLPAGPEPEGGRTPTVLLADARFAELSPDGLWLAYNSSASGRNEVYLRTISATGKLGREIPVTRDGCAAKSWRLGANTAPLELGYRCQNTTYMVTVTAGPDVRISKPRVIADVSDLLQKMVTGVALLPDGRLITGLRGDDEERPTDISITLGWLPELNRRMAAEN